MRFLSIYLLVQRGIQTTNLSGVETATLRALAKKDLVECHLETQDFRPTPVQLAQMPLTPNDDQKKAIQHVVQSLHHYQAFLLDGLTGSGKTEVYLRLIDQVLRTGKQALILVPEIALTATPLRLLEIKKFLILFFSKP